MSSEDTSSNSTSIETINLYKYMSWEDFEKILCNWDVKITQPHYTNDPFELMPATGIPYPWGDQSEKSTSTGFLCFSKVHTSAALWGHYADSHRGVCMGFSFPVKVYEKDAEGCISKAGIYHDNPFIISELLLKINYTDARFNQTYADPLTISEEDQIIYAQERYKGLRQLLSTKDVSWSFEEEYRIIYDITMASRVQHGMVFTDFPLNYLTNIYLGTRCPYSTAFVITMLAHHIRMKKDEWIIKEGNDTVSTIGITQMKYHDTKFKVESDIKNNSCLILNKTMMLNETTNDSEKTKYVNNYILQDDGLLDLRTNQPKNVKWFTK